MLLKQDSTSDLEIQEIPYHKGYLVTLMINQNLKKEIVLCVANSGKYLFLFEYLVKYKGKHICFSV